MVIKRIVIVGGGSAGWIAASYINAVLRATAGLPVEVMVVESPDVGRIGVGEATIPTIRHVLQTVGMAETDFMRATDATFKQAIKFVNWRTGRGDAYYHPFDRRPAGPVDNAAAGWLSGDRATDFSNLVSAQPRLCEEGLAPKPLNAPDYSGPMPYAYHMDAEKFADALAELATRRGVTRILDDVVQVEQAENGDVCAVATRSGRRIEGDFFIDCTGFAALLAGTALRVDFVDFSPWLLCDRAIAMRVPYDVAWPGRLRPYTTATALSAGWCWDIGLMNRRGVGYVYSSQFLDDDAAEAEVRAFEGDHCEKLSARRLKFRVGRRAEFWVRNCLSIGLSSGFIEPLESTGLYLAEYAAVAFCEHFPLRADAVPIMAGRVNRLLSQRYDELLDFINLHYCLSQRVDSPFWREVARDTRVTDRLRSKLEYWRHKVPSSSDFDDHFRLFSYQSYEHVLYGMGFDAGGHQKGSGQAPRTFSPPPLVVHTLSAARSHLPSHEKWLQTKLGCTLPLPK